MEGLVRQAIEWLEVIKEHRFLKKHGCETREEYNRKYDPDFLYTTSTKLLKDVYIGYPYFFRIEVPIVDTGFYGLWPDMKRVEELNDWCRVNCKDKWRSDVFGKVCKKNDEWQRVQRIDPEFWQGIESGIEEDQVFFAFRSEKDGAKFLMSCV